VIKPVPGPDRLEQGLRLGCGGPWTDRDIAARARGSDLLLAAGISPSGETGVGWAFSVAEEDASRARSLLSADGLCREFVIINELSVRPGLVTPPPPRAKE
jgi:hypothetical protein